MNVRAVVFAALLCGCGRLASPSELDLCKAHAKENVTKDGCVFVDAQCRPDPGLGEDGVTCDIQTTCNGVAHNPIQQCFTIGGP